MFIAFIEFDRFLIEILNGKVVDVHPIPEGKDGKDVADAVVRRHLDDGTIDPKDMN